MRRGVLAVLALLLTGCGTGQGSTGAKAPRLLVPKTVMGPAVVEDFDLGMLVPRRGRVRRVWKPARDQILIEWTAVRTPSLYSQQLLGPWGLVLWTRVTSQGFASRWRSYELPLTTQIGTGAPKISVELGDVTSDARQDVLVAQYAGNHGCGPHRVVATVAGRPRVIFRRALCESSLTAAGGMLKVSSPEYGRGDGVCCPSFFRETVWRWTGLRLVRVSSRRIPQRRP